MIVTRQISLRKLVGFTRRNLTLLIIFTAVSVIAVNQISGEMLRALSYASGFLGTALAFLIGFRNNAAYARWWEGQKLWSKLKYESRNLGLMVCALIPDTPEHQAKRRDMLHRQAAFVWRLNRQLRTLPADEKITSLMTPEEAGIIEQRQNPSLALLNHQAEAARNLYQAGLIDSYKHVRVSELITACNEVLSGCKRLKKTPFPMQYTWFTAYSLTVFLFILPLSLAGHLGYWSVPFSLLIGYIFVMLEYVGRYIEHPFENSVNDIPMDYISRTVEIDLREMLGEKNTPPPVEARGLGYLY